MSDAAAVLDPALTPLTHFAKARDELRPTRRLQATRAAARALREEMLAGPRVTYYRACSLIRVPYPTRFAFSGAARLATPLIHILNRLFVIQVETPAGLKTVLVSPSDVEANKETPFFKRLARRARLLGRVGERLLAPVIQTVPQALERIGLAPEDVDYVTYDHLHTQDLRRWLGTRGGRGLFPNARLLVHRREWESVHGLFPLQTQWYCPHGADGIDPARVEVFDRDVALGGGLALVHTPGHTEGNHSIVAHTPAGLLVTSENGVSTDCYAPLASGISGLARYARETGAEVVLNANTLEQANEQYVSMVQEKELAGPSSRDPAFPNVVPSSEATPYWAFPGLRPTFTWGELEYGALRSRDDAGSA
jgi:hypothetical protein